MTSEKKVLVALSGGIDSSVAALLLKEKGWEVEGIHFLFSDKPGESENIRNLGRELKEVRKIARKLGIKLRVVNRKALFKKKVINYLIREYKKGNTPNPCVICNKEVKIFELAKIAKDFGFINIATGHYTRKVFLKFRFNSRDCLSRWFIQKGKDKKKDQSYFLSALESSLIEKCIFPLGDYYKKEISLIGKKAGLFSPFLKESRGICFSRGSFRDFIKNKIFSNSGKIINQDGNIIGNHEGLCFYTIGQREAIKIGEAGPYFVTRKDYQKNELHVSNIGDDPQLFSKEIRINLAVLGEENYKTGKKIINCFQKGMISSLSVKIRYGPTEHEVLNFEELQSNDYRIIVKDEIRAITKGQIAAVYNKRALLFGGIII